MTEQPHPGTAPRRRRWIYLAVGIVLGGLLVLGALWFQETRTNAAAIKKAQLLRSRMQDAGLSAPAVDTLVNTFGDDGRAACAHPVQALENAEGLTNGAAGPGSRPTVADVDIVQGEILVIATYCPDKLAGFTKEVRRLKLDQTVQNSP